MDVKGKITIFPKKIKVNEEDMMVFNGTLTSKVGTKEKPEYLNKSVEVRFSKERYPQEKLLKMKEDECYQLEIEEGFLRVGERQFNDVYIQVLQGTLKGHKPFEKKSQESKQIDDDLPF